MELKKSVTIIPARGGSKSIPKKNIVDINGKPLIAYIIEASIKSDSQETWVSTDDDEIAEIAKKYGAKTLKRPKNISLDKSDSESALLHFAKEKPDFDILIFLQATSPLTRYQDINKALDKMKKYDSVLSVIDFSQFLCSNYSPLYDLKNRPRRQDLNDRYIETGAIYVTKKINLLKSKTRISGKIGFLRVSKLSSLEIDTYEDLKLVKKIMQQETKSTS